MVERNKRSYAGCGQIPVQQQMDEIGLFYYDTDRIVPDSYDCFRRYGCDRKLPLGKTSQSNS